MEYSLTEKIENIFNPRSFPEKTYIRRVVNGKEALEDRLGRALAMKGNLVFVSGASKSGKTVLCILSTFNPIKKLQKSLFSARDFPSIKRDFIV